MTDSYVNPRHRDDLQGLRAIAVLLVALNHAGLGFMKGGYVGVDVFFVLSGFLITQLLLAEAAKSQRVSLVNFYIRRARRILPAAALTLVATNAAAYYLLNPVRAQQTMRDSVWAALFGANINFSRQATDYFAQGQPASPLLHFWSLSVEEQFYFVWPTVLSIALLGMLAGLRLRRGAGRFTSAAVGGLMIVALLAAAASFGYSHHLLQVNRAAAYFSSLARAWELALGAVLAIALPLVGRIPAAIRLAAGWVGLAFIGVAAVTFSSSTPIPGKAALLPTLGAALVIASGIREREERRQAGCLLGLLPLRYVGDRSYTFYLWHWPFLAIAVEYEGRKLSTGANVLLLAVAFAVSIVTFRYFENPIRRMKWRPPVGLLLWPVSAACVLAVAFAGIRSIDSSAGGLPAARAAVQPAMLVGASEAHAALPAVVASVKAALKGARIPSQLVPPVLDLQGDVFGTTPGPGCWGSIVGHTSTPLCYLRGPSAPASSTPTRGRKTLLVLGDSHAAMWIRPLLEMAQEDDWDVVPLWKDGCLPGGLYAGAAEPTGSTAAQCHAWFTWARETITRLHPDTVFVSFLYDYRGLTRQVAVRSDSGTASLLAWARTVSRHVVFMLPSPNLYSIPLPVDCLEEARATLRTCTGEWGGGPFGVTPALRAIARRRHVGVIDPVGWFCYEGHCPQVIGHSIVYVDSHHVTRTYATALAAPFRAAFRAALQAP